MIRFYKKLQPFYAITVDLDDTLYDNYPIISKAEDELVLFLRKFHPALFRLTKQDCDISRKMLKIVDPEIYHDVNCWRWISLEKILLYFGLSKCDAQVAADCAMEIILFWRNQICISCSVHDTLSALSSRWPLIAITNGNSNPIFYGLKKYFNDVLRSGINGRAKPYADMYLLASKLFELPCKYILHVGDDLVSDIQGSICAGMQACWINQYNLDRKYCNRRSNAIFFPHLEIFELKSLVHLL